MFRSFSASYAGHVVDDNLGFEGMPANDRNYPNEKLAEAFDWALDFSRHLESLGYDEFWMAEHHFQTEGYECIPNLLMLSLYLASNTERLKYGCGFNITPMWHPLRLAEDYAMADILTGGRLIFGVGRGYHSREVETFGAPVIDNDANRELFEEQMEIILKAFNEDSFSHKGKYYTIPPDVPYRGYQVEDVTLVPRPLNRPVEIWQPIASGRTLEWIAQRGIKAMVALTGEVLVDRMFNSYHQAATDAGRDIALGQDMCLGFGFCLDDNRQKAIDRVRPYHDERYKWFAPFGFVRYTDSQGRPWGTPGAPTGVPRIEDGVQQKAWYCGPGDGFVPFLKEIEAKYPGLEDVMLQWPEGMPWLEFKDQLSQFAAEVMPAFTGREAMVAGDDN